MVNQMKRAKGSFFLSLSYDVAQVLQKDISKLPSPQKEVSTNFLCLKIGGKSRYLTQR